MWGIVVQPSRRTVLLSAAALVLLLPSHAAFADPDPPSTPVSAVKGAQAMGVADLKGMIDRGERVIIIDARHAGAWEKRHIAGALKVNWRPNFVTRSWSFDAKPLGADKAARIVIYGDDEQDGWAGTVVNKAVAEGFTSVMWLRGGFAEWVAASLPTVAS